MIFKKFIPLTTLLILTSCSSVTMKEGPKTYSKETVKSFEEIERENAIERYRKLRLEDLENAKSGRKKVRRISPKRYVTPKRTRPKPRPSIIPTNPDEQRIEVEQNLKFFCMEKRKDPRFSAASTCESFTENILSECESSYQWNDKKLTRCVKSKLR
ncbi:putative exported protein [Halobacteriovorax marinus SJ]|uniref:Exported protein n=1 Tax=Halobacteriovorax marinus (strain ATCC BAA-682 / DSM 15412 / SJ) TaxID=862908 RepID=E1WZK9_HALMS|nr:hypothetical protein [Halobacteriovorax marinus]CBW26195.1 putative exported protein [Halobacteriovorax marinus SJ]